MKSDDAQARNEIAQMIAQIRQHEQKCPAGTEGGSLTFRAKPNNLQRPGLSPEITLSSPKEEQEQMSIRLDLDGKLLEEFNYLKDRRGLKNNSELIRVLLSEEYLRVRGETDSDKSKIIE